MKQIPIGIDIGESEIKFALCAAGTLLVFCAIYALVYGLTTRTNSRIEGGQ